MPHLGNSLSVYTFGQFEIDEASLTFRSAGEIVALPIKPWATLLLLAQNAPDTVSKNELIDSVWQGRVVTEGVLTQVISRLRAVLGDENQEIIKTLYGVGFRLALPVTRKIQAEPTATAAQFVAGSAVRGYPSWALLWALSTSKRTAVWLAAHENGLDQRVFKFASDGSGLRALKREFSVTRVMQAAQTANGIAEVIDADFTAEPFFISLRYFNAGNLVDYLEANPDLAKQDKLNLLISIALTVAQCHAAGIIHGDIKPKNILVDRTGAYAVTTRLADFGAAVLMDQERLKTLELSAIHQTGMVMSDPGGGTLTYAAPELLAGKPASTASDAYAFGVTTFQLLSGEFSRPLSPGWEELLDDPLLQADIRELCQANPAKRPTFSEIAERLATLDERTENNIIREQEAAEFEAVKADAAKREQQRTLDAARINYLTKRRRLLQVVALGLASLSVLALSGFFIARYQSQIARAQTELAINNAQVAKRSEKRSEAVQQTIIKALAASINPYNPGGDPNTKVIDLLPRLADQLVAALPDDPAYTVELLTSFSVALLYAKEYASSEAISVKALRLGQLREAKRQATTYITLAEALRFQGFQVEASQHLAYAQQHAQGKDAIITRTSLASILLNQGKPEAALRHLISAKALMMEQENLTSITQARPSFQFGLKVFEAHALAQLGRLKESEALFQAIIVDAKAKPENARFMQAGIHGLAQIRKLQGQINEAISLQKQAIAQLDKSIIAGSLERYEIELAAMLVQAIRLVEAKELLQRHLKLPKSPSLAADDFALAQEQLSIIYLAEGKTSEAAAMLANAKAGVAKCLGKQSSAYQRIAAFELALK